MEVAEMKMMRYSLGKTKLDRVKNEDIRRKILVGKFSDKLRETRLRWLGHVVRRNEEYVGRRMKKWRLEEEQEDDQSGDGKTVCGNT